MIPNYGVGAGSDQVILYWSLAPRRFHFAPRHKMSSLIVAGRAYRWGSKIAKYKAPLSALETAREIYNYPPFNRRFRAVARHSSKMIKNYSQAFRQRLRGTKYSSRRRLVVTARSRARRKRMRRVPKGLKSEIGERVGHSTCKRAITQFNDQAAQNQTFATNIINASGNIFNLAQSNASNDINRRQRHIINCRGFNIRVFARNNGRPPLYLHLALIAPRDDKAGVLTTDFFRGYGDTRGEDGQGIIPSFLDQNFSPINTDEYVVVRHWTKYIAPDSQLATNDYVNNRGVNHCTSQIYVPINRQIRYEGDGAGETNDNMQLVWWAATPDKLGGTNVSSATALTMLYRVTMFFREPKP